MNSSFRNNRKRNKFIYNLKYKLKKKNKELLNEALQSNISNIEVFNNNCPRGPISENENVLNSSDPYEYDSDSDLTGSDISDSENVSLCELIKNNVCDESTKLSKTSISQNDSHNYDFINSIEPYANSEINSYVNDFLQKWSIEYNINKNSLSELLKFLKPFFPDLPSDYRTLLKTPRNLKKISVYPGEYVHIGVANNLIKILMEESLTVKILKQTLYLDLNVDGLPVFSDNTEHSFWLILGRVVNIGVNKVFVIGIYHGGKKPNNFSQFLQPFVNEMKDLTKKFLYNSQSIIIKIRAIICDAPARASVCGVKHYNAIAGCPKCTIRGKFANEYHRMCFINSNATLRSDYSFSKRIDADFHVSNSPLEDLGIGMVSQVGLDYLHIVLLGVMKKLLKIWFGKKPLFPNHVKSTISNKMLYLNQFLPSNFQRQIRSLDHFAVYKGSELRNFLLFYGAFVLKNSLPLYLVKHYNHFLKLHVAIKILCCPDCCITYNKLANMLLVDFVAEYAVIYGSNMVNHNVHMLIHLANEVLYFKGPLDSFSSFSFESYMHPFKKLLAAHKHPLIEFANRLFEMNSLTNIDVRTPNTLQVELKKPVNESESENIYTELLYHGYILNNCERNKYVLTDEKKIYEIINFRKEDQEIFVIGKQYMIKTDFYSHPISSSKLNVFQCQNMTSNVERIKVSQLERKLFAMVEKESPSIKIFFPLTRFYNSTRINEEHV